MLNESNGGYAAYTYMHDVRAYIYMLYSRHNSTGYYDSKCRNIGYTRSQVGVYCRKYS